jgi:hypothetical protein
MTLTSFGMTRFLLLPKLDNLSQSHTRERREQLPIPSLEGPDCDLLISAPDLGCDADRLRLCLVHRQFFLRRALAKL